MPQLKYSPIPPFWNGTSVYDESKGSWLKSFFAIREINKAAKQLGYRKFQTLEVIPAIENARNLQDKITSLIAPFEEDSIWRGWDTSGNELSQASKKYDDTYHSLTSVLGLTDDPAEILRVLNTKLCRRS